MGFERRGRALSAPARCGESPGAPGPLAPQKPPLLRPGCPSPRQAGNLARGGLRHRGRLQHRVPGVPSSRHSSEHQRATGSCAMSALTGESLGQGHSGGPAWGCTPPTAAPAPWAMLPAQRDSRSPHPALLLRQDQGVFWFFSFLPCQESHMAYRYNYSFYETHSESTSFNTTSEEQITASINIYCRQDWLHIGCAQGRRRSCPDVAPPAWLLPAGAGLVPLVASATLCR